MIQLECTAEYFLSFLLLTQTHQMNSRLIQQTEPQMMATYYSKVTKIFWISESQLYHGYASYRLFIIQKRYNKNLKHEDLHLMASSVLLAAISVIPYDHKHGAHHFELENEQGNLRMASRLDLVWILKRTPKKR